MTGKPTTQERSGPRRERPVVLSVEQALSMSYATLRFVRMRPLVDCNSGMQGA